MLKITSISRKPNKKHVTPKFVHQKADLIRVKKGSLKPRDTICGLLQYASQNGDTTTYTEVGTGCVMVYYLDNNGDIESAISINCSPGNTLNVEGNHSFGCGCSMEA